MSEFWRICDLAQCPSNVCNVPSAVARRDRNARGLPYGALRILDRHVAALLAMTAPAVPS
jgi:hypothetical protein